MKVHEQEYNKIKQDLNNHNIDALLVELTELRQENFELQDKLTQKSLSSAQEALKTLQK